MSRWRRSETREVVLRSGRYVVRGVSHGEKNRLLEPALERTSALLGAPVLSMTELDEMVNRLRREPGREADVFAIGAAVDEFQRGLVAAAVRRRRVGRYGRARVRPEDLPEADYCALVFEALFAMGGIDPAMIRKVHADAKAGRANPIVTDVEIMERFGWTPEQVDALDETMHATVRIVLGAQNEAVNEAIEQARREAERAANRAGG